MELLTNPKDFDIESYMNEFRKTAKRTVLDWQDRKAPDHFVKMKAVDTFFKKIEATDSERLESVGAIWCYKVRKGFVTQLRKAGILPIVLADKRIKLYI